MPQADRKSNPKRKTLSNRVEALELQVATLQLQIDTVRSGLQIAADPHRDGERVEQRLMKSFFENCRVPENNRPAKPNRKKRS